MSLTPDETPTSLRARATNVDHVGIRYCLTQLYGREIAQGDGRGSPAMEVVAIHDP